MIKQQITVFSAECLSLKLAMKMGSSIEGYTLTTTTTMKRLNKLYVIQLHNRKLLRIASDHVKLLFAPAQVH